MKKITFLLLFITNILYSYSQNIKCYNNNTFLEQTDLLVALNDYISIVDIDTNNTVILIDYLSKNNINIFYIYDASYYYNVFLKEPDCYFIYNNIIVYIFINNSQSHKKITWMETIFLETKNTLNLNNSEIIFINDSTISFKHDIFPIKIYDPPIIEYLILNNKILTKNHRNNMIY